MQKGRIILAVSSTSKQITNLCDSYFLQVEVANPSDRKVNFGAFACRPDESAKFEARES